MYDATSGEPTEDNGVAVGEETGTETVVEIALDAAAGEQATGNSTKPHRIKMRHVMSVPPINHKVQAFYHVRQV